MTDEKGAPAQPPGQSHRQKIMRAHLRFLRHEVRTPINAIIGYGEMLQEGCSPELLPLVVADLGTLLATARRMTHVVAEVLNRIDAEPLGPEVDRHAISRQVAVALAPTLADCMAACERIQAKVGRRGGGDEFSSDLYKIHTAAQQLTLFLATEPAPSHRPYDTPAEGTGALDPTGAFAIAKNLESQISPTRGRDHDPSTSTILVVDDNPGNRVLLNRRLSRHGYRVHEVENATEALARLATGGIDLILLDVLLPGMDGLTLCRTIKADPQTAAIPVLLVTALHERQDRLAGIAAGANDFLSKPIDGQDLLLRCRNALATKRQYDRTVAAYRKLQQLEEMRDRLTHLIVHDMRSPLAGLTGYLDLFLTRTKGQIDERHRQLVDRAAIQARSLADLINHVLDVSQLESGAMPLTKTPGCLSELARQAVTSLGATAERTPVRFDSPEEGVPVFCDQDLIKRVFANLLSNAIRYSPPHGEVIIHLSSEANGVRGEVIDDGPGIAPENHRLIFEKFGQVQGSRSMNHASSGLGLTFCRLAVEAHGGQIGVHSQLGQGSCFWFTLPAR